MKEPIKSNASVTVFQTKDLHLATYLKMKGYLMHNVARDGESDRVIFGFVDSNIKQREKDVLAFYNDDGQFKTFSATWRDMKALAHNYKK